MKNDRAYLYSKHCGTLLGVIHDGGATPVCCGEPMTLLTPNTEDAALEKHVPALTREGDCLKVTVGSTAHPMVEEHYIMWIAAAQGNHTQRIALSPGDPPSASFTLSSDGPVKVYAYCNLHGLWTADA